MKLLLALPLLIALPVQANIFKLPEDVPVCKDLISIQMLETALSGPKDSRMEVINYLVDKQLCDVTREAFVRIVNVSYPFAFVRAIDNKGSGWVYSRDLE